MLHSIHAKHKGLYHEIGHEIFLIIVNVFSVYIYVNDSVKLTIEYLDFRRNKSARKYMVIISLVVFSFSTCPLKSLGKA